MSLSENKADLAIFLSEYITAAPCGVPEGCELVVGGGFADPSRTISTRRGLVAGLNCDHEEADTRFIAHAFGACQSEYSRLIVLCKDTDVLLLLFSFFGGSNTLV